MRRVWALVILFGSLNTFAQKNEKEKQWLSKARDTPSPAFVITDEHGTDVRLSDFSGKTIVLDFWANWCGPCKKSFPAMQRAVDIFKTDTTVKFLFILTWDTSKDPLGQARKYLNSTGFSFDLYLDPKEGTAANSNKAASLFGFKAIPQKYIIDRNGIIRFNVTGFSGTDDEAVEELSFMINCAKKQQ
ncbi:MAG: TlpA family protein disulfide reductase [Chitinophagaceae bacterium]